MSSGNGKPRRRRKRSNQPPPSNELAPRPEIIPEASGNLPERELTRRQLRFCAEYVEDMSSATEAAIRAGYSAKGADVQACRLLADTRIQAVVADKLDAKQSRREITLDKTLREIATLAFSSIDWFDYDKDGNVTLKDSAPADAMQAIRGLKKRTRYGQDGSVTVESELLLWDKPGSLDKLMKHLGGYLELVVRNNVTNVIAETANVQVIKIGDAEIKF